MITIGQFNQLYVSKISPLGLFLDAAEFGTVILPAKLAPETIKINDPINVFLYFDSDNQIAATTHKPIAEVGQWGMMTVSKISNVGAFVNWGIKAKDLLIPFSEQRYRLKEGQHILVYVYINKASGRIVGTTKFNKHLSNAKPYYQINQPVDLLIAEKTELGYKAIIEHQHWGMIFPSDALIPLSIGKTLTGYIKHIREDGKIDLSMQPTGATKLDDLAERILALLTDKNGFLPLTDKSDPREIFTLFNASKGAFKKSIGSLYKKKLIAIKADGIYLV